ncbi:brassinosteroid-related acyltransferase 1 [Abrus precatorius]|uniref:Brassinosteroid-related acyltransferase 1 n=1 Tax=Abrus precatorius TaxID=3816 RepID=A0A8B8JPZ4_ABRPR|nr:brassinosteroid-related acyltransferase 1 [Abrus precatorius]
MAARHENDPSSIVSILRIVSVHPKLVQPQRVLTLSNLDRQCPKLMHLVFFYNNLPHQTLKDLSLNSVFSNLKSGLEETLTLWYPGAGRLRPNQSDGKLNLWCSNQGAVLAEAETPLKISQLGNLSEYNEFFEKLVYEPACDGNFSNMPLIVAQVTKFGCGGYSIGIGTSHSLFDGPATYDFLYAWASNSEIVKRRRNGELPKPVHERGILQISNSSLNAQKGRAMAIDHLYQLIMQATSGQKGFPMQIGVGGGLSNQNKCVLKTYHLSGVMIDDLKRKHFSMQRGSIPFSTFEVLAAHLWKARTKALGVRKEKLVCLQFAVDIRSKMIPSLPNGFSGNAYVLASIMMSVGELEQASHESIIEKIREAKNNVNHGYVKAYIDALEGPQASSLPPLKELTLVSDWTRMPFHNIEFFHGKATSACPLATPIPQVAYFMQSPIDNFGVDVRIGLEAETLSAFTQGFLSRG